MIQFGKPFVLKSDNGLCYSAMEFHDFLEFYQVHNITSSPHYPQSNGFAEALIGISKKFIEKSVKDGKPWNYGLLEYRVTPVSGNLPSPLEALTGQKPRTSLPQIPSSVGKSMETSRIYKQLLRKQPSTSNYYTMELKPGQPVFVKEAIGNVWKTGVIDQPTNILDQVSRQFHTKKDKIHYQTMISTFLFQVGSCKEWNGTGTVAPHSYHLFT